MGDNTRAMDSAERQTRYFKLKFGKYKGWTLNRISRVNPSYILWMLENLEEGRTLDAVKDFAEVPAIRKRLDEHIERKKEEK